MTVLSEIPPTLGEHAFESIPNNISISVPCSSLASYKTATGWKEFTNYYGIGCYEITATANPAEAGVVTGAGSYGSDAPCTLIAIARDGFTFINWTENDVVVSTNSYYSFIVNGDRNLVANFGTTGLDESSNKIDVYPNPVERGQTVRLGMADGEIGEVQVDIINALGVLVETRRATSLQAPNVAGVYTLRITVEGQGTCYRKLIVR